MPPPSVRCSLKMGSEVEVMLKRSHRLMAASAFAMLLLAFALAGCSSSADGQALVKSKCVRCHELATVEQSSNATHEQWEQTVKLMEAYGLQVTAEERAAIIDHLAAGGGE